MDRQPLASDFLVRVAWAGLALSLLLGSAYAHKHVDHVAGTSRAAQLGADLATTRVAESDR
jgi:hypothetical protein